MESPSIELVRGHADTIIMNILMERDRYGYEIIEIISTRSHGRYSIKQPTLYNALKRLEKLGFVESYYGEESNGGRRRYYCLTEKGTTTLTTGQKQWEFSRTILDTLLSDKDVDLATVEAPYDPNALRPATKRIRSRNFTSRIPTSEREADEDEKDESVENIEEKETSVENSSNQSQSNVENSNTQLLSNNDIINTENITLQITDSINIIPISPAVIVNEAEKIEETPISPFTSIIETQSITSNENSNENAQVPPAEVFATEGIQSNNTLDTIEASDIINTNQNSQEIKDEKCSENTQNENASVNSLPLSADQDIIQKEILTTIDIQEPSSINQNEEISISKSHESEYQKNEPPIMDFKIVDDANNSLKLQSSNEDGIINTPYAEQTNLTDIRSIDFPNGVIIAKETLEAVVANQQANNELLESMKVTIAEIATKNQKEQKSTPPQVIIKDFSNHPLFRKDPVKSVKQQTVQKNEVDPYVEARKLNAADKLGLIENGNAVLQRNSNLNLIPKAESPKADSPKIEIKEEIDYSSYLVNNTKQAAQNVATANVRNNNLNIEAQKTKENFEDQLHNPVVGDFDFDIEKQDYIDADSRSLKELKNTLIEDGYKVRFYSKPDAINYYNLNYILGNKILRDTAAFLYMFIIAELLSIYIAFEYFNYSAITLVIIAAVLFLIPLSAFVHWQRNPAKRTKARLNFTNNMIYSLIILVLTIAVITITTLLLDKFSSGEAFVPYILSLNIPIATIIYYILYKSKSYHIKN
ncbi:MAG: helix-turn-helix transcriptional regulator [Christensenellaceae bacterium]|jgi:PadR family transcriptional regulator PadR|nr:helix-turn-helix transcriptional regulator [Christensenellaceae bacterium]